MNPEDRIKAYLFSHLSTIQNATVDEAVSQLKLSVFFGMSPLSDAAIRQVVVQWATVYAVGMLIQAPADGAPAAPPPGKPASSQLGELIDTVKRAVSTVNNGVTLGKEGANLKVKVTGLTANLKSGDSSASLGISWSGTLKLDAESGPFHFSGSLSKDSWEIELSLPQDSYVPDLSSVGKVFTEGDKAIGQLAQATRHLSSVSDAGKIGALVKTNVSAIQDAVSAIAGPGPKGGATFGFKLGSPDPGPGQQGMPGGVQGTVVFTYVF